MASSSTPAQQQELCTICGEDMDSEVQALTRLKCKACGDRTYHEHCIVGYKRALPRIDASRMTGFPCPRGYGHSSTQDHRCKHRIDSTHQLVARKIKKETTPVWPTGKAPNEKPPAASDKRPPAPPHKPRKMVTPVSALVQASVVVDVRTRLYGDTGGVRAYVPGMETEATKPAPPVPRKPAMSRATSAAAPTHPAEPAVPVPQPQEAPPTPLPEPPAAPPAPAPQPRAPPPTLFSQTPATPYTPAPQPPAAPLTPAHQPPAAPLRPTPTHPAVPAHPPYPAAGSLTAPSPAPPRSAFYEEAQSYPAPVVVVGHKTLSMSALQQQPSPISSNHTVFKAVTYLAPPVESGAHKTILYHCPEGSFVMNVRVVWPGRPF